MTAPFHLGVAWMSNGREPTRAADETYLVHLIAALAERPENPIVSVVAEASDLARLRSRVGPCPPSVRWISTGKRGLLRLAAVGRDVRQFLHLVRLLTVHGANQLIERFLLGKETARFSRGLYRFRLVVAGLLLFPLFPLAWGASLVNQVVFGFLMPVVGFPFLVVSRLLRPTRSANELNCDVWVRPRGEATAPVLFVSNHADPAKVDHTDPYSDSPPPWTRTVPLPPIEWREGPLQESVQPVFPAPDEDGRTLLRVMQEGHLFVCAAVPVFQEILAACPECTLWFQPDDTESVARAIRRTLAQKDRFLARQAAARRRLFGCDWSAVAAELVRSP